MKPFLISAVILLLSAATSCSSVTTRAYSNGTVASANVDYTFESPQVFKTGRGIRYFVSVQGAPSWEKVSIPSLQAQGMGRTAERERAKLVLTVDVMQLEFTTGVSMPVEGGFTPALEVKAWYQLRYDNVDGEEVSGGSGVHVERIPKPNGAIFALAEDAEATGGFDLQSLDDPALRELQTSALETALKSADSLGQRLFSRQAITVSVPVVQNAAGVELEAASSALLAAESDEDLQAAEALYQSANSALDARQAPANATSRYGILCGLAVCRLMVDDFVGAWDLTTQALRLEPNGEEATAIRAGIYEEELRTGLRTIPTQDRKWMDQQFTPAP